jgi:hypothetical protein
MTTSAGKGAGMPQQSFEPDQMIGWTAEQAAERPRAEGFGPVLLVEPEQVGAPGTLELFPSRVRPGVRDGRVVAVEGRAFRVIIADQPSMTETTSRHHSGGLAPCARG